MVVPKLVLTLSGQTCDAIYRNSDKVRSSLSFQQAPADVCTSNRSCITAIFVKTVANAPEEQEVQEADKKNGNVQCSEAWVVKHMFFETKN